MYDLDSSAGIRHAEGGSINPGDLARKPSLIKLTVEVKGQVKSQMGHLLMFVGFFCIRVNASIYSILLSVYIPNLLTDV